MRLMGLFPLCFVLAGPAGAVQDIVKDSSGKTVALVFDCNSCKSPNAGATCMTGVEAGFHDGAPCGQCMVDANFGTRMSYAHDLHFIGYVKDGEGEPAGGRFVQLITSNPWKYRTRTRSDGGFTLILGATADRKGPPIVVDLGVRTTPKDGAATDYRFYMMPESFTPCASKRK